MKNQKLFIERLNKLMDENHDNNTSLAEKINVTSAAISLWRLGEREPKVEHLSSIADIYDVSVDYLIGRAEY